MSKSGKESKKYDNSFLRIRCRRRCHWWQTNKSMFFAVGWWCSIGNNIHHFNSIMNADFAVFRWNSFRFSMNTKLKVHLLAYEFFFLSCQQHLPREKKRPSNKSMFFFLLSEIAFDQKNDIPRFSANSNPFCRSYFLYFRSK